MIIEVTPSGQRIVDNHGPETLLIDMFDKVLAEAAQVSMDFSDPNADYVLDNVRLLRSAGSGMVYGIRITALRKIVPEGRHVFIHEGM